MEGIELLKPSHTEISQKEREMYLEQVVTDLLASVKLDKEFLNKLKVIQFVPSGMFEGENIKGVITHFSRQTLPP